MKTLPKYFLLLILAVVLSFKSSGQFYEQISGTNKHLTTVFFLDRDAGFAGGISGTLLMTRDGGTTWKDLSLKTFSTITGIAFISPDTGWVVGDDGLFLHTTTGGQAWDSIAVGREVDLTAVQFLNHTTGYVTGHSPEGGMFYKTTDGGKTWTIKTINDPCREHNFTTGLDCNDIYLMNLSFLDNDHGVLGGFAYNIVTGKRPFICKTEDGGNNFRDISPQFRTNDWYQGKEIVSVDYLNDHDAIAIMNSGSGTDFLLISDYRVSSFRNMEPESGFDSRGRYYDVEFLGRFIGYFTSVVNGKPQVIKTIDQGGSFMFLNPPTNRILNASAFPDVNTGYFVGENGTILKLTDHSNVVYSSLEMAEGDYMDPPYTIASTRPNLKTTQIHAYNTEIAAKKFLQLNLVDRFGNPVRVKKIRAKIYSDEVRLKVKTDDLAAGTYFYTILYNNESMLNGSFDLNHLVRN